MDQSIVLDGSAGEGGGQILRTALSLSAITGRPFEIHQLRANRLKPGLRPQHREAARAIALVTGGGVEGAEVGSSHLRFRPGGPVRPGDHTFDVGTAGSTPLLFQTLCWPLALAGEASHLTLRGGTHQDYSPTFHYLALVWAPAVARLGFRFELGLRAAGFYPEGGGEFTAVVEPAHAMPPLDLRQRGTLREVEVVSMVAGLEFAVAERQAARAVRRLRDQGVPAEASCVPAPARLSTGAHLIVVGHFERCSSGHGALGGRGESPERTADEAVGEFHEFLSGAGAVDVHLGDQLLLPAALAAAGLLSPPPGVVPLTQFTVARVTPHLLTNAEVIRRFLDVEVTVSGEPGQEGAVSAGPRHPPSL
ncbi:RNA 3'-terminal phosphate cyclase [Anaeromyxobacter paludicola]|uniref:RNA 3'-terminal phosphate cyclase n=1 Tax=Anaeromyxobacter paludicola TaxID=2918171 RepID=A0ABN6N358_9BACT|nr:RNA 3'-terminal phosphate cyclase [Anaeromyxobacter paludicola]BDG07629.1 RNA 3'-phosphate cyclase [Anaeromyxobacter paludicola]